MSKHTPGPWRYDHELDYCGEIIASNGTSICSFTDEPSTNDARLIAAAPDLLAVLQELVKGLEAMGWDTSTGKAHATIAKATGEMK